MSVGPGTAALLALPALFVFDGAVETVVTALLLSVAYAAVGNPIVAAGNGSSNVCQRHWWRCSRRTGSLEDERDRSSD